MSNLVLDVRKLHVQFQTRRGAVDAVRGVDLSVGKGEIVGVVGESGSGKSVTALSALGLLDHAGRVASGEIYFRSTELTKLPKRRVRALRGTSMSMIFQNPRAALNPIRSIRSQIADALKAHKLLSSKEADDEALDLLRAVRLRDPERRASSFPHELSGGMCQRVMIAIAIACQPELLIADEPTTGLDVTTQKIVMDLLVDLVSERGMAMMLITHDLGLAARYCDRVVIMEKGQVIETGNPTEIFTNPKQSYSRKLVASSPTKNSTVESLLGETPLPSTIVLPAQKPKNSQPLLQVSNLVKRFDDGTVAVDDVTFEVRAGQSVGLVGESGSGKSTISRLACRLLDHTSGTIFFSGDDIGAISERRFHLSRHRKDIQLVFQDAGESLNPRFCAADSILDPIKRLEPHLSRIVLENKALELAQRVGLPADLLQRFPHQMSGGQRARVGIARAISVAPKLLILDEPTAALDVSVQAIVLNLLDRLRRETGMAYLFVSHDLNVVRMMCEQIVVLQNGRIVEQGHRDRLFNTPETPYTRELLDAIPTIENARGWIDASIS